MDIAARFYYAPPFSKFLITMIIVTTVLQSFIPLIPIYWCFAFSIKKIVSDYQIWRIYTNFLLGQRKLSLDFLFLILNLFNYLTEVEKDARNKRKISFFFATLFYLTFFLVAAQFIKKYFFSMEENRILLGALCYAFMTIGSYREPNTPTRLFFLFQMKNKYTPFAIIFLSLCSGGDISQGVEGIIVGFLYLLMNDIPEAKLGYNFIFVPGFIQRLFKDNQKVNESPKKPKEKQKEVYQNIAASDTSNTAFRERENVAEGNEFNPENFSQSTPTWS